MTQEEIDKIVEQHQHWLKRDCKGWECMMADLRDKNLSGLSFESANLSRADLRGADLYSANLRGVSLYGADLYGADLYGADLRDADLRDADLREAILSGAQLQRANLSGANLRDANLRGAYLSAAEKYRLGQILTEPMMGYKKTNEGVVITAEIPVGAIVFCINGRKFRTNRAKITDMAGHGVLHSQYDKTFEYRLGQDINIKDFCLMYNVECASGFHFFKTRKEAEEYQ